jgi:hypothetical protein
MPELVAAARGAVRFEVRPEAGDGRWGKLGLTHYPIF